MSGLSALSARFVIEQWMFHQTADVVGEALMSKSLIVSIAEGVAWLFRQSGESRIIASQSRKDDRAAFPTAICIAPEESSEKDAEDDEVLYTPYPGPQKSRFPIARAKMPEPDRRTVQLQMPRPPPTAMVKLPARQEPVDHDWNAPTKSFDSIPLSTVHISPDGKYLAWVKSVGSPRLLVSAHGLVTHANFFLSVQQQKAPYDLLHYGKCHVCYTYTRQNNFFSHSRGPL